MEYGLKYSKEKSIITLYTPLYDDVILRLYEDGVSNWYEEFNMKKEKENVFEIILGGDLHGKFYTFIVHIDGVLNEITDPYSVSTSVNSNRSAIVDTRKDEPIGFRDYKDDAPLKKNEILIYELHIADTTNNEKMEFSNRARYVGGLESLKYKGEIFGLGHLIELGVTHVHIMPINDFASADELSSGHYNWGYDPEHYNAPEGSYAIEPADPLSRIVDIKTLIHGLHENGIKVILDVVYNHTYRSKSSNFFNLFGEEFYRMKNGEFSNGSGCGNELNTENPFVRNFIIDSLKFWTTEYLVDGFRFDLMSLIDKDTMFEIEKELTKIKPNILLYGEPWAAGNTTLSGELMPQKGFQRSSNISVFNDEFRIAIRGNNHGLEKGYASGNLEKKDNVIKGMVGEINYSKDINGFCDEPMESINYFSCHDNLIIFDKFNLYKNYLPESTIYQMNKFAFSILFTAQGIPFIQQGTEFLRTKRGEANSYNIASDVNYIDWTYKNKNIEFYNYVKDLITFRKRFSNAFFTKASDIKERIKFYNISKNHIEYHIEIDDVKYEKLIIIHNPTFDEVYTKLEKDSEYILLSDGYTFLKKEVIINDLNKVGARSSATTIIGKLKK